MPLGTNIKETVRLRLESGLSRLGPERLLRLAGLDLLSVFYHKVEEVPPPYFRGGYRVKSPGEFESDLDQLLREFNPVSLDQILEAERGKTRLPPRSFFLSFDDGYRELAELVAPILLRKGVPATFFITSSLIDNASWLFEDEIGLLSRRMRELPSVQQDECERICLSPYGLTHGDFLRLRARPPEALAALWSYFGLDPGRALEESRPYLTRGQIHALLDDGFSIGAHGTDHTLFHPLTLEEQLGQVRKSIDQVAGSFDLPYRVFAFPYGEFGVSRQFFETARREGLVDLFFGTRGLVDDEFHPFVQQRLWCENHEGGFRQHLRSNLGAAALRGLRRTNTVRRPPVASCC